VEKATIDDRGSLLPRAGGCLAAFGLSIVLLSLGLWLAEFLPSLIVEVLATAAGLGLIKVYIRAARARWLVEAPDVIQALGQDLRWATRRATADFRLRLPPGRPLRERLLHEAFYTLKCVGTLLVVAGLGTLIYGILLGVGLVQP